MFSHVSKVLRETETNAQAEILESLKTKVVEIKTESEGIYKKLHGAGKAETVDEGVIQYTVNHRHRASAHIHQRNLDRGRENLSSQHQE